MASSLLAIKKQLECSICCETIKTPKILEACNHVFCKQCISDLAQSRHDTSKFPCPECRAECKLPEGGVDALKDDFRVANLIAILGPSLGPSSPAEDIVAYACSICDKKEADAVCDSCDLDLCPSCRKDHGQSKETMDHLVYDLCVKHGRRRKHYCSNCDAIICMRCLKSDHSQPNHATMPYNLHADNQLDDLTKRAEAMACTTKSAKDTIRKVDKQLTEVKVAIETRRKMIADKSKGVIQSLTCEIYDVRQEIEGLQTRLGLLEKTKADHIEDMEAQLKEMDDDDIGSFDIVHYQGLMSEKAKTLDFVRQQLSELKEEHWLGDSHRRDVAVCFKSIGEIEKTLQEMQETIGKVEGACQRFAALAVPSDEPGTTDEPLVGTDDGSLVGTGDQPLVGTGDQPLVGTDDGSLVGTGDQPLVGTDDGSLVGTGDQPLVGTGDEPLLGTSDESLVGTSDEPLVGTSDESLVGTSDEPLVGTDDGSLVGTGDASSMDTGDELLMETDDDEPLAGNAPGLQENVASAATETPSTSTSPEQPRVADIDGIDDVQPGVSDLGATADDITTSPSQLVREWDFTTAGPSCIYSIVSLGAGMAILGGTSDIHPSKIFYFPKMEQKVPAEIAQGVSPSRDMAANSSGDLVLLRAQKPHLRVYIKVWNYQWYNTIPSPDSISCPQSVTCAGTSVLVLDGLHPNVTICVLSEKGEVLHSLRDSFHGRLAYSPLTRLLYRALPGSLQAFKVSDGGLSQTGIKIPLAGIVARDICCGSDGTIYAAGKTSTSIHKKLGHLLLCLIDSARNQVMVGISDSKGQPVFVDETADRIRLDICGRTIIIGSGSKVFFYQLA